MSLPVSHVCMHNLQWIKKRVLQYTVSGTFSVGLLRRDGDRELGRSLFVGTLERMVKGVWRRLLVELVPQDSRLQVSTTLSNSV